MKFHGLVAASLAKFRQRKQIRYGRLYFDMPCGTPIGTRMKGLNLITHLDDASRCTEGAALLREATSENAVAVLRQAAGRLSVPATIPSDNGFCFAVLEGAKNHLISRFRPCLGMIC